MILGQIAFSPPAAILGHPRTLTPVPDLQKTFNSNGPANLPLGHVGVVSIDTELDDFHVFHTDTIDLFCQGSPRIADCPERFSGLKPIAEHVTGALGQSGRNWPKELCGEFLIIVYDHVRHGVTIATDRFARYPVYYCKTDTGKLVFGTDPRAVVKSADRLPSVSTQAVYDFLFFTAVPGPQSIFDDVSKLPAAVTLQVAGQGISISAYEEPIFNESKQAATRLDEQHLQKLLGLSVSANCEGDSVGCFLSGGLDSSTIAGLLSQQGTHNKAFTIGFDEPGYDETQFAKIVADHFNLTFKEYCVTPGDVVGTLSKITNHYPEPFGNASAIPAFLCAQLAVDEGVQVLLGGDGGDEIFGGNERYSRQLLFEQYTKLPLILRKYGFDILAAKSNPKRLIPGYSKLMSYIRQANLPLPARLHTYNLLTRTESHDIFQERFLESIEVDHPLELQEIEYNALQDASTLNRLLYLDWKFALTDNDLVKVSNACSLAGIKVRYPFLDASIVDFSKKLASADKATIRQLRPFYRNAVKGFLPDAILTKSKHGFGLPFGQWMVKHRGLADFVSPRIRNTATRGIFLPEYIKHLEQHLLPEYPAFAGELVWPILMLELWFETNFDDWSL